MTDARRLEDVAAKLREFKQQRERNRIFDYKPYAKQYEFHRLGADKTERLLTAGNQLGKALPNGTPVLTPEGWCEIAALRPGDEAIGGDGHPCRVTGVFPQGTRETVELLFDDGASLICDWDHLWTCRQGKKERASGGWFVRTTREMLDKGGAGGGHKRAEIPVCSSYLRPHKTLLPPYIVGLLLGDGCLSGKTTQAHFSSADEELVRAFEDAGFGTTRRRGTYDYAVRKVTALCRRDGLWGKLSYEKEVPKEYLFNGRTERLALLQGLMDTDGTAGKGGDAHFYTTSPGLRDAVVFIVRSLGGKATVRAKQTYFYQKGKRTAGRPSWAVAIRLPMCPFRLKRKAARWRRATSRGDERRLVGFKGAGFRECTCIAVDSSDHTYVTKDFIVTHNTLCGAHEAAFHATGMYPEWWPGRVWQRPTRGWTGGESSTVVRDTTQKLLLGDVTEGGDRLGTGIIPSDQIVNIEWSRGVALGVDTAVIRNKSGGNSVIKFKSYEMQRQKWQGDTIDWVWYDEEPPADIYSEGLARFTATDGMAFMTFTPLKGMSTVVKRFFNEDNRDRAVVKMTVHDAPHISGEGLRKMLAKYPQHEHDCRINGVPMQGEGRIFTIAESVISCAPFDIPAYWKHIIGLDLGHGQSERAHPTAAVWMAIDPDTDTCYIYHTYRVQGGTVPVHAAALRARGTIPVAWPHDAMAGDKFSGKTVAEHYRENGCKMLREHAKWQDDGSLSVARGIVDLAGAMETGKFRVFATCTDWFEEYRNYHMEISEQTGQSKIVAIDDDLLSATRYARMMRRFAKPVERSLAWQPKKPVQRVAAGMDFDPFTGR